MGIKQWQGKGLGINTQFPPKESPILGEILVAIVFGMKFTFLFLQR